MTQWLRQLSGPTLSCVVLRESLRAGLNCQRWIQWQEANENHSRTAFSIWWVYVTTTRTPFNNFPFSLPSVLTLNCTKEFNVSIVCVSRCTLVGTLVRWVSRPMWSPTKCHLTLLLAQSALFYCKMVFNIYLWPILTWPVSNSTEIANYYNSLENTVQCATKCFCERCFISWWHLTVEWMSVFTVNSRSASGERGAI